MYKKGKSKSKRHHTSGEDNTSTPARKRAKISETVRVQRIAYVQDAVADISKQIGYKNLRIEQAKNSNQFALCEKVTEEIRNLKQKRFRLETELKVLHRKQQQSAWYKSRKRKSPTKQQANPASHFNSECKSSSTAYPGSSSLSPCSRSSTPATTHATPQQQSSSPSMAQSQVSFSSPISPSPISPISPVHTPISPVHSGDTLLLSSESDAECDSHFW